MNCTYHVFFRCSKQEKTFELNTMVFFRNLYLLFFFLASNENVLWPFSTFSFNIEPILQTSSVGDKTPFQTWSLIKNEFNWHFCSNKKSADFRMNFVKIILKMTSPFWVKVNNLSPSHLVVAENKSGTILHVFFHSWRYTWYSKNGASNEERFDLLGSSYCKINIHAFELFGLYFNEWWFAGKKMQVAHAKCKTRRKLT